MSNEEYILLILIHILQLFIFLSNVSVELGVDYFTLMHLCSRLS